MATDERNFRSAYYEKVGFRSVEEKKSLEILLKDNPLDCGKLKQFCLRFSVPGAYRKLVWQVVLGVIPVHVNSHNFVMDQRKQEYQDLIRSLKVTKEIDHNTPKQHIFLAMWMLHSGTSAFDDSSDNETGFFHISQAFLELIDDEMDAFWLSRNFYTNMCKFEADMPKMIERAHFLLEKEDAEYFKYLSKGGLLDNLPMKKWFECCFAGVLNEMALAKIWDKLCGGSYKILVYVVVALLMNLKHRIYLKCNNINGIVQYFKNISEEAAEIISTNSIELWQQHGSPLTIHDKPKP